MSTFDESHGELAELMEEPPGGANHGRRMPDGIVPTNERPNLRPVELGETVAAEFLRGGGWHVEQVSAHRGVLRGDEYVDLASLRSAIEAELGFTFEQVHAVYRQGPMTAEQRELRGQIDARLLALSRSGARMALLGKLLGFPVKANGNCRAVENALTRARQEELQLEGSH